MGEASSASPPNKRSKWLPLPHVLDIRSLALFRILFGILQIIDVYCRLRNGKYDLAWYTAYPQDRSYIPERVNYAGNGLFTKLWFFKRGTARQELLIFAVYTVCLICMTIGYHTQKVIPVIWLILQSFMGKSEDILFGGDLLAGQLLIAMALLPMSHVWSVDSYLRSSKQKEGTPTKQVENAACFGLTLQIVMMYMGCFFLRTFDEFSIDEFHESDWLWPDYSLVHYCANGSGTYNNWFTKMIRETLWLNQIMTISGFVIETLFPTLCFVLNQRYSHCFAVYLMALHYGIGRILALPHFSWMGTIIHVIWIPTHVWDRYLGGAPTPTRNDDKVAVSKKTDGDAVDSNKVAVSKKTDGNARKEEEQATTTTSSVAQKTVLFLGRLLLRAIRWFYVYLLIITFIYQRGWFRKKKWPKMWRHVRKMGRLADDMWFYSEWNMWSPGAVHESPYTVILGWREAENEEDETHFNIYQFMKTGEEVEFEGYTDEYLDNSTYDYPSTRWEKAIGDEYEKSLLDKYYRVTETMGVAMCTMVNEDLAKLGRPLIDGVEILVHTRELAPPGSKTRYDGEGKTGKAYIECLVEEEAQEQETSDDNRDEL